MENKRLDLMCKNTNEMPTKRRKMTIVFDSDESASRVIQKYWRQRFRFYTTKNICRMFEKYGFSVEFAKSTSIIEWKKKACQPLVLRIEKLMIKRLFYLSWRINRKQEEMNILNSHKFTLFSVHQFAFNHQLLENHGLSFLLHELSIEIIKDLGDVIQESRTNVGFNAVRKQLSSVLSRFIETLAEWMELDKRLNAGKIENLLIKVIKDKENCFVQNDYMEDSDEIANKAVRKLFNSYEVYYGKKGLMKMQQKLGINEKLFTSNAHKNFFISYKIKNEKLAYELLMDSEFQLDSKKWILFQEDQILTTSLQKASLFEGSIFNEQLDGFILSENYVFRMNTAIKEFNETVCKDSENEKLTTELRGFEDKSRWTFADFDKYFETFCECVKFIASVEECVFDEYYLQKGKILRNAMKDIESQEEASISVFKGIKFLADCSQCLKQFQGNKNLRNLSKQVKEMGVDYLKGKFAHKLQHGSISTSRLRLWMIQVLQREMEMDSQLCNGLIRNDAKSHSYFHSIGLFSIIVDRETLTKENCPEIFFLDYDRILNFQHEFKSFVMVLTFMTRIKTNWQELYQDISEMFSKCSVSDKVFTTENWILMIRLKFRLLTYNKLKDIIVILDSCFKQTDNVEEKRCIANLWMNHILGNEVNNDFVESISYLMHHMKETMTAVQKFIQFNKDIHGGLFRDMARLEAIRLSRGKK